jgi:hypothetical protein
MGPKRTKKKTVKKVVSGNDMQDMIASNLLGKMGIN